ncbi:tumor necrosis factor-like [Leucoraja erinacea]|uniref:tumor necrosis factor-like n=1 Tax=Leucoraja erinaceus TaxID=7782 RepID=UPI002455722E|nr:tumor necrosis factor-like [Leucoraja erinacea]
MLMSKSCMSNHSQQRPSSPGNILVNLGSKGRMASSCTCCLLSPLILLLFPLPKSPAIPNAHRRMRISWRKQGGALTGGVDLRDNALVISIPGLYFVYTQVTFYNSSCPDNLAFLSHNLQKLSTSYRGRQTLLSSMASTCRGNNHSDTWFESSYHGAAFKLAKGDQLFSVVSPGAMAYVNSDAEKTYFGLFALSRSPPT